MLLPGVFLSYLGERTHLLAHFLELVVGVGGVGVGVDGHHRIQVGLVSGLFGRVLWQGCSGHTRRPAAQTVAQGLHVNGGSTLQCRTPNNLPPLRDKLLEVHLSWQYERKYVYRSQQIVDTTVNFASQRGVTPSMTTCSRSALPTPYRGPSGAPAAGHHPTTDVRVVGPRRAQSQLPSDPAAAVRHVRDVHRSHLL